MTETIYFYDPKKPFGEFSNYYASPIVIEGFRYPTVEHYFQTMKFLGPDQTYRSREYAGIIVGQNTPNKAKVLATQRIKGGYKWRRDLNQIIEKYTDVKLRVDWETVKDNVMRAGVFNKFVQNPSLRDKLLSTRGKIIVEHTSRDGYWGDGGDGSGLNKLGRILVETREILLGSRNGWIIYGTLCIGKPDYIQIETSDYSLIINEIYRGSVGCLDGDLEAIRLFTVQLFVVLYKVTTELATNLVANLI